MKYFFNNLKILIKILNKKIQTKIKISKFLMKKHKKQKNLLLNFIKMFFLLNKNLSIKIYFLYKINNNNNI
jgi:hypothetical protein